MHLLGGRKSGSRMGRDLQRLDGVLSPCMTQLEAHTPNGNGQSRIDATQPQEEGMDGWLGRPGIVQG